jgi:thiol-disulfide isomerase/thioredoxin
LAVEVGQRAPKFSLLAVDGKGKVDLSAYRGKVVYLDFWASWCPPCRKAMPEIEKLRKSYSPDEFAVVAVNVDSSIKKAQTVLSKTPVGYAS